eukprot:CAMPEP_0177278770 /NCGR_PEP_ID=MMETSP0367-20130122/69482_1 /TAXON_ID=447022 ORGANISM="Scrippsiella hangoei-like, Strain SHHI-4" /NCGR_SAMPLE_ID=MMETSP0367 /ASSEMBLY_ACC=CAM_ASM_000362 /LENGTH=75 /DNA_ID=CAMNT_0018735403 /DNA_START=225 /DNA_END=452 /DNA_ORIENTATION=-
MLTSGAPGAPLAAEPRCGGPWAPSVSTSISEGAPAFSGWPNAVWVRSALGAAANLASRACRASSWLARKSLWRAQ